MVGQGEAEEGAVITVHAREEVEVQELLKRQPRE